MSIKINIDASLKGIGISVQNWPDLNKSVPFTNSVTNNEGEFLALIMCLETVIPNIANTHTIHIRSDSNLLVKAVNDKWVLKKPQLQFLLTRIRESIEDLEVRGYTLKIKWIPRSCNKEADELSRCKEINEL